MKKISVLTLVLNNRCNFSCSYCPQLRGRSSLRLEDIRAFTRFLRPRLARKVWLGFTGGEPLLSWPLIEQTVALLRGEKTRLFRFTLTTNGSLLRDRHIRFFKKNRFRLVLSYDGLAQARRDKGSVAAVETALAELQHAYPEGYIVNSVFGPRTVRWLAASMEELAQRGHRHLRYSLDTVTPWRAADLEALEGQLERLAASALLGGRKPAAASPLENMKKSGRKGVFACLAGSDRLALLPDRTVWGCEMFHAFLERGRRSPDYGKYCFGELGRFMAAPAATVAGIAARYAQLRQDYFFTAKKKLCSLCDDLERCAVCPAGAALASGTLAVIPEWTCQLRGITRRVRARFT